MPRESKIRQTSCIFRFNPFRLMVHQDPRPLRIAGSKGCKRHAFHPATAGHLKIRTTRKAGLPDASARIVQHHKAHLTHPLAGSHARTLLHTFVIPVDGDGGNFCFRGQLPKQAVITPLVQLFHRNICKVTPKQQVIRRNRIYIGNHLFQLGTLEKRIHMDITEKHRRKARLTRIHRRF